MAGLLSGARLDAAFSVLATLMVFGIVLDVRAHSRGISFAEEGFFTPEHVFFYSMFLGIAALLGAATYRERRRGADWVAAVPTGYGMAVVGVLVFGLSGVGDFFWHSAFGFEEGFQALVSPTHIGLGLGGALFLASPVRAVWRRDGDPALASLVAAVVSTTLVLTMVSLFGAFLNPLVRPYPHYQWASERFVVTVLAVYPLLFVGTAITVGRRVRVPPGTFLVAFTVPGLVVASVESHPALAVPALVAGLLTDVAFRVRPPTPSNPRAMRAFAVLVPVAFAATYFGVVELQYGLFQEQLYSGYRPWTVHVLGGAVVNAGLAGLLFASAVAPGDQGGRGSTGQNGERMQDGDDVETQGSDAGGRP